jgi:uncharacterized protein (DUF1684 family)
MKYSRVALTLFVLAACGSPTPDVDPEYRSAIEQWRTKRLERLTADDGWLTVVGLHWLADGVNRVGGNRGMEVALAAPDVPPLAATLELTEAGTVIARAATEGAVTINGQPLTEATLKTDAGGQPDVLQIGRITLFVIDRSGRLAVRVKDPESEARTRFTGIESFPIDPAYRVAATLEAYESPREVSIPTVTGTPTTMLAPGLLHFQLGTEHFTLEPYVESPDDDGYFVIFRDRTSGDTTYGGGRFLTVEAVDKEGTTVIDFNYAYSPPCAFTAFATCPLPTPQNSLPVAITAGEKHGGGAHHG